MERIQLANCPRPAVRSPVPRLRAMTTATATISAPCRGGLHQRIGCAGLEEICHALGAR